MQFLGRAHIYFRDVYSEVKNLINLSKKACVFLYKSRSWTAFGIRILNRLYSNTNGVPPYMYFIFPKSTVWCNLMLKTKSGSGEEILRVTDQLLRFESVFFQFNLSEFSLDNLLSKIEERSPQAFNRLHRKKVSEYLGQDQAPSYQEIEDSFYLNEIPKVNFHIDPKMFLFALPVKYLYRTQEPLAKLEDYLHCFRLPNQINLQGEQSFEYRVDGDMIWSLSAVKLFKGYQILSDQNYICYEKSAEPAHKFIAGYLDAKPWIKTLGGIEYVKLSILNYRLQELGDIFLVSGRCTRNYFHWLIEYMPKLLWLKRLDPSAFGTMSIAVDSLMPQQHYQVLDYFLNKSRIDRNVVKLDPDKTIYQIERMLACSNPTFIPDSLEEFSYPECSALNLGTLGEFREVFLNGLENKHDKKIYIARLNNLNRKLVNEPQIIELFERLGFKVVYPELLTFEEQLALFHGAKYIVGPAGAAFSNLIFCQEHTVVINFLAEENKEYSIFSNLCALSNSDYYLVTGRLLKSRELFPSKISWLYSDFEIDIDELEKSFRELVSR